MALLTTIPSKTMTFQTKWGASGTTQEWQGDTPVPPFTLAFKAQITLHNIEIHSAEGSHQGPFLRLGSAATLDKAIRKGDTWDTPDDGYIDIAEIVLHKYWTAGVPYGWTTSPSDPDQGWHYSSNADNSVHANPTPGTWNPTEVNNAVTQLRTRFNVFDSSIQHAEQQYGGVVLTGIAGDNSIVNPGIASGTRADFPNLTGWEWDLPTLHGTVVLPFYLINNAHYSTPDRSHLVIRQPQELKIDIEEDVKYTPWAIKKGNNWMSCNRTAGGLYVYENSSWGSKRQNNPLNPGTSNLSNVGFRQRSGWQLSPKTGSE